MQTDNSLSMPLSIPTVLKERTSPTAISFVTNVLVIGGAYAGLAAVKSIKNHFRMRSQDPIYASALENKFPKVSVTLIEPRAGLLNIIGIPKAIVDPEFAKTQYIPFDQLKDLAFDKIVSNDQTVCQDLAKAVSSENNDIGIELNFVHGKATYLDENTAKYQLNKDVGLKEPVETGTISFDYVIMATGRDRKWPTTPDAFTFTSYLQEMKRASSEFADNEIISIIGAGAVGLEIAGDVKAHFPEKTVNLIHPHSSFPPEPLSEKFRSATLDSLQRGGVNVLLNTRIARELPNGDLVTTNDETIKSSLNHWCTSHKNNTAILSEHLCKYVSPANNVYVNEYLQLTHENDTVSNFFVIGDLVEFSIIKSAGWAMYMGRQCANNITSLILDNKLIEPFPDLNKMPRGMVLVAGNGEIISQLADEVEVNHAGYVKEYEDYCIGKVRVTMAV